MSDTDAQAETMAPLLDVITGANALAVIPRAACIQSPTNSTMGSQQFAESGRGSRTKSRHTRR